MSGYGKHFPPYAPLWTSTPSPPPAPDPRDAVIAQLVGALSRVKHSIEIGGGGGVTDVVWLDDLVPETVCDFIESALAAAKAVMP